MNSAVKMGLNCVIFCKEYSTCTTSHIGYVVLEIMLSIIYLRMNWGPFIMNLTTTSFKYFDLSQIYFLDRSDFVYGQTYATKSKDDKWEMYW